MKVQFIKKCPWTFFLTKKLARPKVYYPGDIDDVADIEAESMIKTGYAKSYIADDHEPKEEEKKAYTPYMRKKRFTLYEDNFSLNGLKDFCKEKELPYKTTMRTKSKIINLILDCEEQNKTLYFEG